MPVDQLFDNFLNNKKEEEEEDEQLNHRITKKNQYDDESSTYQTTRNRRKKLYDQAIPIDVKRVKEEKDVLKLSENSSIQLPKEKEEL